jgi:hypothetical protein
MHAVRETNIDALHTKELFHFQLPAAHTVSVSTSQSQGF